MKKLIAYLRISALSGCAALAVSCTNYLDLNDPDSLSKGNFPTSIGHIDLLINNAGQPSFKTPTAYEAADVDKCLKGLKGMILWCVQTLKACDEQNLKIANVMSTAATRGNANESVYCATKWGEKGYTQSLKAAYKGSSVTVVGVYPGGIDTDFYRESHDYVSLDKQHTFMPAADLAGVMLDNLLSEARLTVSDILIERLYR